MNKYFILISLVAFLSCTMNNNKGGNEKDKFEPELCFFQKISDFGIVPKDTILIGRYYFTNTGNDTLNIKKVSPDCICTGYHLSKNNILPRDTAYIELVFNTEHKYGKEKVYAIVEANTNVKMYKLTLKANVY